MILDFDWLIWKPRYLPPWEQRRCGEINGWMEAERRSGRRRSTGENLASSNTLLRRTISLKIKREKSRPALRDNTEWKVSRVRWQNTHNARTQRPGGIPAGIERFKLWEPLGLQTYTKSPTRKQWREWLSETMKKISVKPTYVASYLRCSARHPSVPEDRPRVQQPRGVYLQWQGFSGCRGVLWTTRMGSISRRIENLLLHLRLVCTYIQYK